VTETDNTETREQRFAELLTEAKELAENRSELWTWLDADPSVAWDDDIESPDTYNSFHGKLRALYLRAGWESCYHRDGARFHYNVKVNGNGRYRGFRDVMAEIEKTRGDSFDTERVEEIANGREEWERETWWEDVTDYVRYDLSHKAARVYSCGRSGGYANCSDIESDPVTMVELAKYLESSREYANSVEAGRYEFETALEQYDDEKMADLASPRLDRIEA
jgi:hypothetical protein